MSASLRCRFSPHTTPLRVYQQAPVSLRRCSCRLAPARGSAIPHAEDVGWGGAGVGDDFLGKRLGDVTRAAGHADLESRAPFEAVFDFYVSNQGDIGIITQHPRAARRSSTSIRLLAFDPTDPEPVPEYEFDQTVSW